MTSTAGLPEAASRASISAWTSANARPSGTRNATAPVPVASNPRLADSVMAADGSPKMASRSGRTGLLRPMIESNRPIYWPNWAEMRAKLLQRFSSGGCVDNRLAIDCWPPNAGVMKKAFIDSFARRSRVGMRPCPR